MYSVPTVRRMPAAGPRVISTRRGTEGRRPPPYRLLPASLAEQNANGLVGRRYFGEASMWTLFGPPDGPSIRTTASTTCGAAVPVPLYHATAAARVLHVYCMGDRIVDNEVPYA